MSNRAASAKKVVVLYMCPWMSGLKLVGVGAVMLMTGSMTALGCRKLGQLIHRKLCLDVDDAEEATRRL